MAKYIKQEKTLEDVLSTRHDGSLSEDVQKMKSAMKSPKLKQFFEQQYKWYTEDLERAKNSVVILNNKEQFQNLSASLFEKHPESPTARKYLKAFHLYSKGKEELQRYTKKTVDNLNDCDFLQPVFHNYAKAYLCENNLYNRFCPPEDTADLITQYLKLKPDDILSEYLKIIVVFRTNLQLLAGSEKISDFDLQKSNIVTLETFLNKMLKKKYVVTSDYKEIIVNVYYTLGSTYAITDQPVRAQDAFERCYEHDPSDYSALFGVAYYQLYENSDHEKAVSLFLKYLDMAPYCDKQYPKALYHLGVVYVCKFKDELEGLKYYHRGLDAEKLRLPFLPPVNSREKEQLNQLEIAMDYAML